MSDLHDLCKFGERRISGAFVEKLKELLRSGIPATYTIEEAFNYTNDIDQTPETNTTPLHIICQHTPIDATEEEMSVINDMVTILFEYGAGWSFTDINNDTPGCILIKRGLKDSVIYEQVVQAGVRAELLLRKVNDNIEFIEIEEDDDEDEEGEEGEGDVPELVDIEEFKSETTPEAHKEKQENKIEEKETEGKEEVQLDPAEDQQTYLNTKLMYKDDALVTSNKDGVMMSWEENLMQLGCDSILKGAKSGEAVVLNIGFGMGIIDTMIQAKNPKTHYICEAHPDVLKKLKDEGWYEKPNVVILEGRWQDTVPDLLTQSILLDGIYYDTYSEHYSDMLDLFDSVVGLLATDGVFSFFNGLGADRQVIYEVYKRLVEIDLKEYGLDVSYTEVKVEDLKVWDDIKRSYWNCPIYYHPEIRFMDF